MWNEYIQAGKLCGFGIVRCCTVMKSKTNCSPQYNNAIEKGSGNITMILTLLMIANDSSMVLLPPVVAEAKQDDSIVTNTMSLTIDDGPFD